MPRNRFDGTVLRIRPKRVSTTFAFEDTAVAAKMA